MTNLNFSTNLQTLFFLENEMILSEGVIPAIQNAFANEKYVQYGVSFVDFEGEYSPKSYPKRISNVIYALQEENEDESLEISSPGHYKFDYAHWNSAGYTVINTELKGLVTMSEEEFLLSEDFCSSIEQAIRTNNITIQQGFIIQNLNVINGLIASSEQVRKAFRALDYDDFKLDGTSYNLAVQ